MKYTKSQKAFTLIEMLVVLLVITILIFVAIPNITKHSKSINNKGCEAFVNMVQGQVEAYEMEFHTYPASVNELVNKGFLQESRAKCSNGNSIIIDKDGKVSEDKSS
ncbi:competence type IV pilus major pilin ComGC [Bacillus sp. FJAT-49736]|uniref:competence type IV pilus major pilin ComGC n=1 Tax=Bacillus sp. FJAT-49736 TaxID=2833582 RepID=UPI001BC8E6AC|nr:competence type IV pilus major pilin ComGC [Bacillus sp. FJAT-49736]MBS4173454.1 prepilin-type N-terminal cleavage/methylation domain-containing protein [Bacillus sp. FJAT-49736]